MFSHFSEYILIDERINKYIFVVNVCRPHIALNVFIFIINIQNKYLYFEKYQYCAKYDFVKRTLLNRY